MQTSTSPFVQGNLFLKFYTFIQKMKDQIIASMSKTFFNLKSFPWIVASMQGVSHKDYQA